MTTSMTGQGGNRPIDSRARIGHVHLKVADLDRALGHGDPTGLYARLPRPAFGEVCSIV